MRFPIFASKRLRLASVVLMSCLCSGLCYRVEAAPVATAVVPTSDPTREATKVDENVLLTVSGQVLSSEPNASYSLSITLVLPHTVVRLQRGIEVIAETTTDGTGRYNFNGVPSRIATDSDTRVQIFTLDPQGTGQPQTSPYLLAQYLNFKVSKKRPLPSLVTVAPLILYSIWGQVKAKSPDKKNKTLKPVPDAKLILGMGGRYSNPTVFDPPTALSNAAGYYVFKYLPRARHSVSLLGDERVFSTGWTAVKLPGTRSPIAPSVRVDIVGTAISAQGAGATSIQSS